jgi:hypothetical protein
MSALDGVSSQLHVLAALDSGKGGGWVSLRAVLDVTEKGGTSSHYHISNPRLSGPQPNYCTDSAIPALFFKKQKI